ncbi:hypothetical protein KTR9_2982 [Gordonia sp. KTR9]|nr:hypothetical protein KTR9_2982 [Gordonia sp. KTR9]
MRVPTEHRGRWTRSASGRRRRRSSSS